MSRETLGRHERIRAESLFKETYEQNCRAFGRHMVLFVRRGEGASRRMGVVASRKVGGAVARARAKRRLRELFRRNRDAFVPDVDVILIARKSILRASWTGLEADLFGLARQLGLMK